MDFEKKTAIITGAASGMGLLTCQCLAAAGANVVMLDVSENAVKQECGEITQKGGSAIAAAVDVRRYDQIAAACKQAFDAFGSIDLAVNFAGGSEIRICSQRGVDFVDVPIEVYDWGIDVNLKGQFYLDHAVMRYMRQQKSGVIINIGSTTGEEGSTGDMGYATAKAGVMYGLTKSIALYGAPYGVRCCCVVPGPVLTRPGMAGMNTLLSRAAQPQELVDMVLYLASDKAAFITGTVYFVDGGRSIMKDKNTL